MGCKSCTSGGCGSQLKTDSTTTGCNNNGACGTGGCNKMNVFDWLSHMDVPTLQRFDVVEIKFKGGRKEYFRNTNKLELYTGDAVIVEVQSGHNLGFVSLQGELVRLQLLKKNINSDTDIKTIYRKATDKDLEKHEQAINRDHSAMYRTRELVTDMKLNMKLSDVEFQSDNTKATFYYSSDDRVDFRELIKVLAAEFKVRIEMKQISMRQEASRIGGIGVCGRELCCSTWLSDFKNVNTSAARYQNLSLNPVKLSGQCGRLKCCLNYELDTYMEALKDIPTIEERITITRGQATLVKTDIFRKLMWFSFDKDDNWYSVSVDRVVEIMALNKKGIIPSSFDDLREEKDVEEERSGMTVNSDLARLDKKYSNNKNKKKKKDRPSFDNRDKNEGQKPIAQLNKPQNNRPPQAEKKPQAAPPQNSERKAEQPMPNTNNAAANTTDPNAQRPNPNKKKKWRNKPKGPGGGGAPSAV